MLSTAYVKSTWSFYRFKSNKIILIKIFITKNFNNVHGMRTANAHHGFVFSTITITYIGSEWPTSKYLKIILIIMCFTTSKKYSEISKWCEACDSRLMCFTYHKQAYSKFSGIGYFHQFCKCFCSIKWRDNTNPELFNTALMLHITLILSRFPG